MGKGYEYWGDCNLIEEVRGDFIKTMIFKLRMEGGERVSCVDFWGKNVLGGD